MRRRGVPPPPELDEVITRVEQLALTAEQG
jgi:hypothetical protein